MAGLLVFLAACAPDTPVGRPPLEAPTLSAAAIRTHQARLNQPALQGRRTATVGLGQAADYVAGQLRAYGLQPVHPGEYRHLTYGPINHPRGVVLIAQGPDSTLWSQDEWMLPDPRSAATRMTVRSIRRVSPAREILPAEAGQIAIVDSSLTDEDATRLAALGYRAALIVRQPATARTAVRSPLGLIQIHPDRLEEVLTRIGQVSAGEARLQVFVDADFERAAGYVHVLGMVPGSTPMGREQLTIVAADLDSGGNLAGVPLSDPAATGLEAAALLEVARVVAADRALGRGSDRTILFAWFSGGAQGSLGLQTFMEHPLWPRSHIQSLMVIGSRAPAAVLDIRTRRVQVTGAGPDVGLELAQFLYEIVSSEYWLPAP